MEVVIFRIIVIIIAIINIYQLDHSYNENALNKNSIAKSKKVENFEIKLQEYYQYYHIFEPLFEPISESDFVLSRDLNKLYRLDDNMKHTYLLKAMPINDKEKMRSYIRVDFKQTLNLYDVRNCLSWEEAWLELYRKAIEINSLIKLHNYHYLRNYDIELIVPDLQNETNWNNIRTEYDIEEMQKSIITHLKQHQTRHNGRKTKLYTLSYKFKEVC